MKNYRIFWGIMALLGGVLLLLHLFNIGTAIELIPKLGSVILLAVSITGFVSRNFFSGLLPVSGILYLWRDQIGLPDLNLWLLLAAAALLAAGLSAIFGKWRHTGRHFNCFSATDSHSTMSDSDEFVSIDSNFSGEARYIRSVNLKQIRIESNFSGIKVYFDQCRLHPDGLTIIMDSNFSGVTLFVPKNWQIIEQCSIFAGSVNKEGLRSDTGESVPVTLTGEVNFGEVKIIYI